MRVNIGSVQRVKERGEAAQVLCKVEVTTHTSSWISYRKLNNILSSTDVKEANGDIATTCSTSTSTSTSIESLGNISWDKSPLDATAFLFNARKREALAAELESRLRSKRINVGHLFGGKCDAKGENQDLHYECRGDCDFPVKFQLHRGLIQNLVRLYACKQKLHTLLDLAKISSRFTRLAFAFGLSVALVVTNRYMLKRTNPFGLATSGFAAGVLFSAGIVHEVLRKRMHAAKKLAEDNATTVGQPGLAKGSLQRVLETVVAEVIRIKGDVGREEPDERSKEDVEREDEVIRDLDAAEAAERCDEGFELAKAHMRYLQGQGSKPRLEFLWRYVRAVYSHATALAEVNKDDHHPATLLEECLGFSKELVERFPESHQSHKYHALVYFDHMESKGTRETIIAGLEFHRLTLHALELNDADPTLHHMLGAFNYELAKLSWTERVAVKAIFGHEPPKGTFDDAIECVNKAIACRPDGVPTASDKLLMGKCYLKMKAKNKARECLEECIHIQRSAEDLRPTVTKAAESAKTLLAKC